MPTLSTDDLKAAIAAGDLLAVSIDTVVFDAKGRTFDHPVLRRLDQFKRREVEGRYCRRGCAGNESAPARGRARVAAGAQASPAFAQPSVAAPERRSGEGGPADRCGIRSRSRKTSFVGSWKMSTAKCSPCSRAPGSAQRIFDLYFSGEPPFGPGKGRKSEFPDAYALLTLEAYAAAAGKLLLCVSADKGWIEFAARSIHLVCVARLEDALELFNVADQHLAEAIVQEWLAMDAEERIEAVESAFELRLEDLDFDVEADARLDWDAEPLGAVVQFLEPDKTGRPQVIDVRDGAVTFTVEVEAQVCFEASFEFYARDSVDKDYINLGTREAYAVRPVPFELTIKADRSLEHGPVFHEVDVTSARVDVDFGYVEAFPGEDPTHEKY